MIGNLNGYVPEVIDFVLDDVVKEKFSEISTLDFSKIKGQKSKLKSVDDIIKFVAENFTATFPENETVMRKLDGFEITNIREEYCLLQENEVPIRKQQLEETLEEIQSMKKKAEQAYDSILAEVAKYAAQVKEGTQEMRLKSTETFCIALAGYYLFFTWDKNQKAFVLAKAFKIPKGGVKELWATEDKNRQSVKELFGVEFPETEKPDEKNTDGEKPEGDDNLPFADENELDDDGDGDPDED